MRLQGAFRHALIVVTTGLFASGCLVDIVFDPVGTDATVAATWSVEGAAPTAESCAELGVTRVRVRFYDGVRRFDHPDLVFDCADGSFDTRPRAVVADGIYDMQLLAIDNAGVVIGEGPRERVDTLAVAGHIQLTAVDFQRAATPTQVAVSWTINGAAPSSASCDALGIARVGIDFMDGGAPSDASCAAGSLTVEVTAGTYSVQVAAFDDQGATIAAAMEQTFTVEEGLTFELNNGTPVDFIGGGFDPRGSDAAIDAAWTVGKTSLTMFPEACDLAGGSTVEFVVYDATDTGRLEGVAVAMAPCADGAFASTGDILASGDYLVSVIYRDTAGLEVGRADFQQVTLAPDDTLDLTGTDIRLADTTAAVLLTWEDKSSGADLSCAEAGVAAMNWVVYEPSATIPTFEGETDEACGDILIFNAEQLGAIGPGDYEFAVTGSDGSDPKAWEIFDTEPCLFSVAEAGDLVITDCFAPYRAGA